MLVLEDATTVHASVWSTRSNVECVHGCEVSRLLAFLCLFNCCLISLLSMYTRKCEKGGDGYFYGVTHENMDRISDSSGRLNNRHHHGSSLMCTGGAESECRFCGATNATTYDGDILGWLTDDTSLKRRTSARTRSNSSGSTAAANSRKGASASSSLLSGLNLADPFANGASIFNNTSFSSASSSFAAAAASNHPANQLLFSSKMNPMYHTARDLKEHECELERSVRLCDTRGYCDTLCVSSDLLHGGSKFVALMDKISQNGFLSTPCYTTYDTKAKIWLWDVTAWFRSRSLFSLGAFLANKLEMVLWMRYWEHTGMDPRKVPSGRPYVAGGLVRERLSSKSPLAHFWAHLATERREKMLTKLILLVEQHAHSLQQQYYTLTGQQQQHRSSTELTHSHKLSRDDDATSDTSDTTDLDSQSTSQTGGDSAQSTPTKRPRRLRHSNASNSSDASSAGASLSASVSTDDIATAALSRTRSHSLPRRNLSTGAVPLLSTGGTPMPNSLPPTSPATPSSSNSAPGLSTLQLRQRATTASSIHHSSQTASSTMMSGGGSIGQQSPWSSMQSSFSNSATTSPSASPIFAPQPSGLHQQLMPNSHHMSSPAPGQLTPTLTQSHAHLHARTHAHTVTYSSSVHNVLASSLRGYSPASSLLSPTHTSTPPPMSTANGGGFSGWSTSPSSASSALQASLPPLSGALSVAGGGTLPSLFKSSWTSDRSVTEDLVRDLMATAAATQVKSVLDIPKHQHLSASYAAHAPNSKMSKEQVEKLKELDWDFTMTGLELLARLLASLTHRNKRLVSSDMPLMARSTSTNPNPNIAASPLTWVASAAQQGSPAQAVVASAAQRAQLCVPARLHTGTTIIEQMEAGGGTTEVFSPMTPDIGSEELQSAKEDSPSPTAVHVDAMPSESAPSTSSSLTSVVGLSMPELLLFAEREAASKAIAVAAARVESLRTSWIRQEEVDDVRFIELLFSSPLARAHTNLDKIIRRIGLLLQACYAQQIGVDLIMGEEAEEQVANATSSTSSANTSNGSLSSKALKKKAKKKASKAAKKSNKATTNAELDLKSNDTAGEEDGEEPEPAGTPADGKAAVKSDLVVSDATSKNTTGENLSVMPSEVPVDVKTTPKVTLNITPPMRVKHLPPRTASADSESAKELDSPLLGQPSLNRSSSTHLSRTQSQADEGDEPWQQVSNRKSTRSSSGAQTARSSYGGSVVAGGSGVIPRQQQVRSKDDSFTLSTTITTSAGGTPLRTPPPSSSKLRPHMTMPVRGTSQHSHQNSQATSHTPTSTSMNASSSYSGTTASSSASASPHFSSSLSFPAFGVRPMSWSNAASAAMGGGGQGGYQKMGAGRSNGTSASLSPASTGTQTPISTLMQPSPSSSRRLHPRSKDDSFAGAGVGSGRQGLLDGARRASVTGLLLSTMDANPSPPPSAVQSSQPGMSFSEVLSSSGRMSPAAGQSHHARHGSVGSLINAQSHQQPPSTPPHSTIRSPKVKTSPALSGGTASPSLYPMPQSPLLPMPVMSQQQLQLQPGMMMLGAALGSGGNINMFAPYSRSSGLHLAKPVPIHSSPSMFAMPQQQQQMLAAYHYGPSSVGLSFSSVPAHHYLTMGTQQRHPQMSISYVHGTDDVTLQAWQQKQQQMYTLAAHQWQQQQISNAAAAAQLLHMQHQHNPHVPYMLHSTSFPSQQLHQQQIHARIPRPSSARRSAGGGISSGGSGEGVREGTSMQQAGRQRSNSAGEESIGQAVQPLQWTPQNGAAMLSLIAASPASGASTAGGPPILSATIAVPSSSSAVQSNSPPAPIPNAASPLRTQSSPSAVRETAVSSSIGGGNAPNDASSGGQSYDSRAAPAQSASARPTPPVPEPILVTAAPILPDKAASSASTTPPSSETKSSSSLLPLAYHSSVSSAQSYQKKQGGQDTPWLSASDRQRFAFSTHTGGGASEHTTPVPLDVSGQNSAVEEDGVPRQNSDSRRPSLNGGVSASGTPHPSLMPNFLVMPSLSSIAQQRQRAVSLSQGASSPAAGKGKEASPHLSSRIVAQSNLNLAVPFSPLPSPSPVGSPQPSSPQPPASMGSHVKSFLPMFSTPNASNPTGSNPSTRTPSTQGGGGGNRDPSGMTKTHTGQTMRLNVNDAGANGGAGQNGSGRGSVSGQFGGTATSSQSWSVRDSWRLHDEVCVFSNYVSEVTTMRQPILLRMIELLRACVHQLWSTAEVECYGSFMTGLCLPTSDLDLVLKGVNTNQQAALVQLSTVLRKQKEWLQSLNAISTAKVPVIKLQACLEGEEIVVDITFDQPQVQSHASGTDGSIVTSTPPSPSLTSQSTPAQIPSVHTGVASVELIRHYLSVFPSLRPLSLVLKQFLFERGLANTYTGGLNSYCLILMIVGFLQSRPSPYQSYSHACAQVQAKAQTQVLDQLMSGSVSGAGSSVDSPNSASGGNTSAVASFAVSPKGSLSSPAASASLGGSLPLSNTSPEEQPLISSPLSSPKASSNGRATGLSMGRARASSTIVQAAVNRIEQQIQFENKAAAATAAPSHALAMLHQLHSRSVPGTPTLGGNTGTGTPRIGGMTLPTLTLLPPSNSGTPIRSISSSPPSSSSLSPSPHPSASPPTPSYGRAPSTENLGALLIEFLDFYGNHLIFRLWAWVWNCHRTGEEAAREWQRGLQRYHHSSNSRCNSSSLNGLYPLLPPMGSFRWLRARSPQPILQAARLPRLVSPLPH